MAFFQLAQRGTKSVYKRKDKKKVIIQRCWVVNSTEEEMYTTLQKKRKK